MRKLLAATAITAALWAPAAQATTELVVQYASPHIFSEVMEVLAERFTEQNPDVTIRYRAAYPNYDEGAQTLLREAITRQMPDLTFQGLNRVRIFADRGIAVNLDRFVAEETDFAGQGWTPSILSLGQVGGAQYGLAFAASTPISYYNLDLVRAAGGDPDNLPTTWDKLIELAAKIDALGDDTHGMYYRWSHDDWMFQALVYVHGGTMMNADESAIAFDGPAGRDGIALLRRFVDEANMPTITDQAARQAFMAGQIGVMFQSIANLNNFQSGTEGRFEMRTHLVPMVDEANGKLPTGGNVVMMLTEDPEKQDAAWRFMKYVTGPEGTATMVRYTGYLPTNQIAADDPSYLGIEFYDANPNYLAAVRQVPRMTPWYAFPGENGVRISRLMIDYLQAVVDGGETPESAMDKMAAETSALLP